MSHELTIRTTGKVEFAFSGSRENIWHKLGSELQCGASIDEWKTAAGMDWEIFESGVQYSSMNGLHNFPDKRVLFRSDNQKPLSIVSDGYKIVQPGEVLEFFRDLTSLHGMKLSAAGTIFGGRKFWATCDIGKNFEAVTGDLVNGKLLFVTSCDSSISNTVKVVSERVICSNTLNVAMKESGRRMIKKSHHSVWNPESVKLDMGLIDESWDKFSKSIKRLAEIEVTDKFVSDYLKKKFYTPNVLAEDQSSARIKEVSELINLYNTGAGSNFSKGTAFGIVNAVTDKFSHGTGKRDPSHQMWNSEFGKGDIIKSSVLEDMFEIFA